MSTSDITAGRVVRATGHIYRRRFVLLLTMSLVVFTLLAGAETAVELAIERRLDGGGTDAAAAGLWLVTGLWTFGSALYAGLCDTIVAREMGGDEPPLIEAWRHLPFARLIALDVVMTATVTLGLAVFVVPGVVIFTLTAIAAPLLVLEDLTVRSAVARSSRLVRPRFWLVIAMTTVPVAVEHEVIHAIEHATQLDPGWLFVLNLVGAMAVLAPVTLSEIVLAHALTGRPTDPVAAALRVRDPEVT